MFMSFWIGWAILGLIIATWLFAWSVRTRQFENGKRASLLPFDDIDPGIDQAEIPNKGRGLFWAMIGLVGLAIGFIIVTIFAII